MYNKEQLERMIVKACKLFYESGASKTQIADILNISITQVNRLLVEARKRGIVQITINAPRFTELEFELINAFHLTDARIVQYNEDEIFLRTELGKEAANYFVDKVKDGNKIGIGSGRTMFEMVKSIQERPKAISIFPISVIAQRDTVVNSMDANTLVNTLWFKFIPAAKGHNINLFYPHMSIQRIESEIKHLLQIDSLRNIIDEMSNLDFYFLSTSCLRRDSVIFSFLQEYGQSFNNLAKSGIIGDYLFNTISSSGEYISCGLENILITVELHRLKEAVKNKKMVIVVAGGDSKVEVIKAGLNVGLFNVLITDSKTAQKLLQIPGNDRREDVYESHRNW